MIEGMPRLFLLFTIWGRPIEMTLATFQRGAHTSEPRQHQLKPTKHGRTLLLLFSQFTKLWLSLTLFLITNPHPCTVSSIAKVAVDPTRYSRVNLGDEVASAAQSGKRDYSEERTLFGSGVEPNSVEHISQKRNLDYFNLG